MTTRRKITIIAITLTIIGLVYIALRPKTAPAPRPNPSIPVGTPNLQSNTKPRGSVNIAFTKESFPQKTELPLLSINPSISKELDEKEVKQISSTFGFTNEPIIANDITKGKTFIWADETKSLVVYFGAKNFVYSNYGPAQPTTQKLTDQQIISTAKDFLLKHNIVAESDLGEASIFFSTVNQQKDVLVETTKEEATLYRVLFSQKFEELPLVFLNPNLAPITVDVIRNGQVRHADITRLENIARTKEKYQVKTFEQVNSSINTAVIMNVDNGAVSLIDTNPDDFTNITLNEVSLGYLIDSPSPVTLFPVYIFKGTTVLKSTKETVSIVMYMPAIAEK